jgi:hypothetical protein
MSNPWFSYDKLETGHFWIKDLAYWILNINPDTSITLRFDPIRYSVLPRLVFSATQLCKLNETSNFLLQKKSFIGVWVDKELKIKKNLAQLSSLNFRGIHAACFTCVLKHTARFKIQSLSSGTYPVEKSSTKKVRDPLSIPKGYQSWSCDASLNHVQEDKKEYMVYWWALAEQYALRIRLDKSCFSSNKHPSDKWAFGWWY